LEATSIPARLIAAKFDGIVGLAPYHTTHDNVPFHIFDVFKQNLLKPRPVF